MSQFVYVYILQSELEPERFYTGCSRDLRKRFLGHNAGRISHTAKFRPWRLKTYVAFSDDTRARGFERYLKSSSGRAFAKERCKHRHYEAADAACSTAGVRSRAGSIFQRVAPLSKSAVTGQRKRSW